MITGQGTSIFKPKRQLKQGFLFRNALTIIRLNGLRLDLANRRVMSSFAMMDQLGYKFIFNLIIISFCIIAIDLSTKKILTFKQLFHRHHPKMPATNVNILGTILKICKSVQETQGVIWISATPTISCRAVPMKTRFVLQVYKIFL